MFKPTDFETVLRVALNKGATFAEIYAEQSDRLEIRGTQREYRTQRSQSGGITLHLHREDQLQTFSAPEPSPEALLHLLTDSSSGVSEYGFAPSPDRRMESEALDGLLARTLPPLGNSFLKTHYTSLHKSFLRADSEGRFAEGQEEHALLVSQFSSDKKQPPLGTISRGRFSIQDFWKSWEGDVLVRPEEINRRSSSRWPCPQGKLSVLWSESATSQILLALARSFEPEAALRKDSWISDESAFSQISFDLRESAGPGKTYDDEGTARTPVYLVEDRKAKAVLSGRALASQLGIEAHGHSRRQDHTRPLVTLPFQPEISAFERQLGLLSTMTAGLWLKEIQVQDFDPVSGKIVLRLETAYLIHHGEPGEPVTPLLLKLSLPEILNSWRVFGPCSKPGGALLEKQNQSFFVETLAPEAFSPSFEVPGEVPLSHYW